MVYKSVLLAIAAASVVLTAPTPSPPTDVGILNFALTLEHLENAFYAELLGNLSKFEAKAVVDDMFAATIRARIGQIGKQKAEHVKFLNDLGTPATQACDYDFGFTDPQSLAALSMLFDNMGDSADNGAIQLVNDKDVLTDVLTRHAPWVSSAVVKQQGFNGTFDVPLTPSGAFSIASLFMKSCPESNPPLPVKTFPALTLSEAAPAHGAPVTATFTPAAGADTWASQLYAPDLGRATATFTPAPKYVAWLNGRGVQYSDLGADGKTVVPAGLEGPVFPAVVSRKSMPTDDNMLSGFTVARFPITAHVGSLF
ncbi:ferritin-like domain-containing protein [Lenzites betulinus]|nr:ferritin-like domain-containing protein [Lenzites betulinus]